MSHLVIFLDQVSVMVMWLGQLKARPVSHLVICLDQVSVVLLIIEPMSSMLPHVPGDLKQLGDPCHIPVQAHGGGLDVLGKGQTEGD